MIFSVCLQVILCIKIKFAIYLYILQHFMLDLQCIYIILIFISILLLFCVYLYYIFEGECSLCYPFGFFIFFLVCADLKDVGHIYKLWCLCVIHFQ